LHLKESLVRWAVPQLFKIAHFLKRQGGWFQIGKSPEGHGYGMQGWNMNWMWLLGVVLIIALALILRARR
jgi:hypothetical protein